jgi:FdhE protein
VKRAATAEVSRVASELERRAARAELLAREAPAAEEPLRFAAGLYRAQGRVAASLEARHRDEPLTGDLARDADRLSDLVSSVLRYAEEEGPEPLAKEARGRRADDPAVTRTRLAVYWDGGRTAADDYLSRASLRPYVEVLRSLNVAPSRPIRRGHCPFCGGPPSIAMRRDGSQSEGARRHLGCPLCGGEWLFQRILCPSCFEEDPHKLPAFQSDAHRTVRIEACETCRRYVKSIDLSEDARPIPEVDDVVSIAMDLWAAEEGWSRIEPGLAGV